MSRFGFNGCAALTILLAATALVTRADERRASAVPINPPVRSLGGGVFEIGGVRLDKKKRTLRFAAEVNARIETIEYAVVHKTGKTHESLFRTETRPLDIQVALLLLGWKGAMTNSFGINGKGVPFGEKIWIEVGWTNQGVRVHGPLEDLVLDRASKAAMVRGEWIYNGSNFSESSFTAQRDGSIVSIHSDADALVNNPRAGRENDDLYEPFTTKLPPVGTPVEIIFRLTNQLENRPRFE